MATENPYVPPLAPSVAPSTPRSRWLNPTLWFLLTYYSLAVLIGINEVASAGFGATGQLLLEVALAIALGTWAILDAERRGRPIVMSAQAWFLLLAYFVVPGYVIVSRGWKGLLWVVVHTIGFVVVSSLAYNIAGLTRYGSEWLPVVE